MSQSPNTSAKLMCLVLLTLLFACLAIAGQAQVPRIFRPNRNPPVQPAPSSPTQPAQPASPSSTPNREAQRRRPAAQQETDSQTGGSYVDDGYTWFEAVSTQELNAQHRPVTTGWTLKSDIRLIGDYPRGSGIKVNVVRAGNMLATTRCEMFQYAQDRKVAQIPHHLVTINCQNKTSTVKELGKFDVQIVLVNGDTDAETNVRNYKIEVLKVDRIAGGFSNPQPDAPHYYVSRHAEAPVSFLFMRPSNAHSHIGEDERSAIINTNTVEIYFNLSPSKEGKDIRDGYLRCSVNGKNLEMTNDKAEMNIERHYEEVYTDRLAAQYKSGTEFRDEIGFAWVRMVLPFAYGEVRSGGNRLNMKDTPGNWECSLMNNGATWRTWRWTVGRDGMLVKHAEQNGNVNLYYNSYLIDTEIPAGGSALDKRLAPTSLSDGFFYGQKWTTAEGKAMAGKVPAKGSPIPVPSNKIK